LKFVKKHLPRIYNIFIDIFAKGAWIWTKIGPPKLYWPIV
jgi:hypothetical protein